MASTSSENTNKVVKEEIERLNFQEVEDETARYRGKVNDALIEDIFDMYGWDTKNEKMFHNLKEYVNDSVSRLGVCIIWNFNSGLSKVLPQDIINKLGKSELIISLINGKFIFKFSLNRVIPPEKMDKNKIKYLIRTKM